MKGAELGGFHQQGQYWVHAVVKMWTVVTLLLSPVLKQEITANEKVSDTGLFVVRIEW